MLSKEGLSVLKPAKDGLLAAKKSSKVKKTVMKTKARSFIAIPKYLAAASKRATAKRKAVLVRKKSGAMKSSMKSKVRLSKIVRPAAKVAAKGKVSVSRKVSTTAPHAKAMSKTSSSRQKAAKGKFAKKQSKTIKSIMKAKAGQQKTKKPLVAATPVTKKKTKVLAATPKTKKTLVAATPVKKKNTKVLAATPVKKKKVGVKSKTPVKASTNAMKSKTPVKASTNATVNVAKTTPKNNVVASRMKRIAEKMKKIARNRKEESRQRKADEENRKMSLDKAKTAALALVKETAKSAGLKAVDRVWRGAKRQNLARENVKRTGHGTKREITVSAARAQETSARQSPTAMRSAARKLGSSTAQKQLVADDVNTPLDGACSLRTFLRDPSGVVNDAASFQLRCKQANSDGLGKKSKVVVVVSGKTRLWKLNQIIAECFNAGVGEFTYNAMQGSTALGSRFIVSRPQNPGQCDKVSLCSRQSAVHAGYPDVFVDDRSFSVSQLFRGRSTRFSLEQEASEAAQQVVLSSPCLGADVTIELDGIMLDKYDSQKLFDKKRRHNNGTKPLPRIVRSSFLSVADIEAKNILMQGSRQGPDFLHEIATPMSALHASSRRSQRKPLFRKDGRDYDLHDLCYVSGDEESDTDADIAEADSIDVD